MDVRAFIVGILAAIALIGAVVLAALERDPITVASLLGLAGTFAGYVVGLYSDAYQEPQGVGLVDEPAGVTRAGELGRVSAVGVLVLVVLVAWVHVVLNVIALVIG